MEGEGGETVLRQGSLLALTAPEAKACGLSAGTVDDFATLGNLLHVGRWTRIECHAPVLMEHWQKSVAIARKEFDGLNRQFTQNMEQARASDPAQFTYLADSSGALTAELRRQWQDRVDACTKALNAAGETLDKMTAWAEKFPQLLADPDSLRKERNKIESMKTGIGNCQFKKVPAGSVPPPCR